MDLERIIMTAEQLAAFRKRFDAAYIKYLEDKKTKPNGSVSRIAIATYEEVQGLVTVAENYHKLLEVFLDTCEPKNYV